MKKNLSYLLVLALVSTVSCEKKKIAPKELVANVDAEYARSERIPVIFDGIGHFVAYNSVEIKAQVKGQLFELHFEEGQFVNEGDPLFTIDHRMYQADLDKAVAERVQMLSKLQYAAEKVARYQTLLPENYVSTLDYIKFQSEMTDFEGAVMEADADIDKAKINLGYCFITAPFSGITSKKLIDIGNLIEEYGQTMLVVKQIDPIFIDFSLPERDFLKISRYFKNCNLEVDIQFPDYPGITFTSNLMVVDNEINKRTGMIPLRAQMVNEENIFWPGQFIRSNLIITYIDNAVIIPETGVSIGQKGEYCYVINKENKAEYRKVKTGEQIGSNVQIVNGIEPGDLVITNGVLGVRTGISVNLKNKPEKEKES